jgi:hypothetical protein
MPFGAALGWSIGQRFGIASAIAGLILGAVVVHFVWLFLVGELDRYFMRQLARSSNEELRAVIAEGEWKFWHSMALLNLAARNEDVRCELPHILAMLESDSVLTRRYGWDALRLVFDDETQLIGDYDPRALTEACREKTTKLREALRVRHSLPAD